MFCISFTVRPPPHFLYLVLMFGLLCSFVYLKQWSCELKRTFTCWTTKSKGIFGFPWLSRSCVWRKMAEMRASGAGAWASRASHLLSHLQLEKVTPRTGRSKENTITAEGLDRWSRWVLLPAPPRKAARARWASQDKYREALSSRDFSDPRTLLPGPLSASPCSRYVASGWGKLSAYACCLLAHIVGQRWHCEPLKACSAVRDWKFYAAGRKAASPPKTHRQRTHLLFLDVISAKAFVYEVFLKHSWGLALRLEGGRAETKGLIF